MHEHRKKAKLIEGRTHQLPELIILTQCKYIYLFLYSDEDELDPLTLELSLPSRWYDSPLYRKKSPEQEELALTIIDYNYLNRYEVVNAAVVDEGEYLSQSCAISIAHI